MIALGRFTTVLCVAALSVGSEGVAAQEAAPPIPVTGRTIRVTLATGGTLQGELIEAAGGDLLLKDETGLRTIPMSDLVRIRAQRHGFDGQRVVTWVVIGAVASGLGMTAACSQVDDTSCGSVFPAIALSWGVVGGLFGALLASSAWADLPPGEALLRPYARFPQGAPDSFRAAVRPGEAPPPSGGR